MELIQRELPLFQIALETPHEPKQINDFSIVKNTLNRVLVEQEYKDKEIQKALSTLGESATNLTEEQVKDLLTEMQFLVSSWLDDYERRIFNGVTLQELMHEKGGV